VKIIKEEKRHQNLLLALLTLSMLLMLASMLFVLHHSQRFYEASEQLHRIEQLSANIVYLDESLTMSARMYVYQLDPYWKTRYQRLAQQLDQDLQQVRFLAPDLQGVFESTQQVNRGLLSMEQEAMLLTERPAQQAAIDILFSEAYQALKQQYAQQMQQVFERMQSRAETLQQAHQQSYRRMMDWVGLLTVLLLGAWLYLLHFLRLNHRRLTQLIATDELTGLHNRRAFDAILQQEMQRALREGRTLMVAVMDVDCFKKYNDRYGHPAGDSVLAKFGEVLNGRLRHGNEFAFRLGGEEFALIGMVNRVASGRRWVEKTMQALQDQQIEHLDNPHGVVTLSAGLSYYMAGRLLSAQALYVQADQALYRAKQQGRNRLEVYAEQQCVKNA
jgi:diguanylate cyclase (GGDEF)-like protein